jgi:hypothetical protein
MAGLAVYSLLVFASGVGIGMCLREILGRPRRRLATRPHQSALPPATARQIRRAARANRADLRLVRVNDRDRSGWLPPSFEDFDNEETR